MWVIQKIELQGLKSPSFNIDIELIILVEKKVEQNKWKQTFSVKINNAI